MISCIVWWRRRNQEPGSWHNAICIVSRDTRGLFPETLCVSESLAASLLAFQGAMTPLEQARANEKKLEKVNPTFSSSVGDLEVCFYLFTAATTNTRPPRVCNLSFNGRQSTVSTVFLRTHTDNVPSSLNEGRWLTRIISNDDGILNYFIKWRITMLKQRGLCELGEIVETLICLPIVYVKVFRLFIYLTVCQNTGAVDELPRSRISKKRKIIQPTREKSFLWKETVFENEFCNLPIYLSLSWD